MCVKPMWERMLLKDKRHRICSGTYPWHMCWDINRNKWIGYDDMSEHVQQFVLLTYFAQRSNQAKWLLLWVRESTIINEMSNSMSQRKAVCFWKLNITFLNVTFYCARLSLCMFIDLFIDLCYNLLSQGKRMRTLLFIYSLLIISCK